MIPHSLETPHQVDDVPSESGSGMLGGAKSVYYADAFKRGLAVTIMERIISNPVRKQEQTDILDALHANCAEYYKAVFGKKSSDETEGEHKYRWGLSLVHSVLRTVNFPDRFKSAHS